MIKENLVAERIAIQTYREMVNYFGDKDPTSRVMMEGILAQEEEHADDMADLLFAVKPDNVEDETKLLCRRRSSGKIRCGRCGRRSQRAECTEKKTALLKRIPTRKTLRVKKHRRKSRSRVKNQSKILLADSEKNRIRFFSPKIYFPQ